MLLPDHKKIVYLPHSESRLIKALYTLACDSIHYCIYKEYFDSIKNKFTTVLHVCDWYTGTVNAYYDLAISNWCKLFGAYTEPTHYYHLLDTDILKSKIIEIDVKPPERKYLKNHLLKLSHLSADKFDQYHTSTKKYRDRNLIHREHSPDKINDGDLTFPILNVAKNTFLSLTLILIQLAKRFPSNQEATYLYKVMYDDFDDEKQICDLIEKSIPKFIEKIKKDTASC